MFACNHLIILTRILNPARPLIGDKCTAAAAVINGWLECLNRNVSDKTRTRHDNVNDIFRRTGI